MQVQTPLEWSGVAAEKGGVDESQMGPLETFSGIEICKSHTNYTVKMWFIYFITSSSFIAIDWTRLTKNPSITFV